MRIGTQDFWDKCFLLMEGLIGDDDEKSLWKKLEIEELIILIKVLSIHDKSINSVLARENASSPGKGERLWKKIFEEYMEGLDKTKFDHYQLYKTYTSMSVLPAAANRLAEHVADSWCKQGFDSDELIELGPKRVVKFIETIANFCPELNNQIFVMHIKSYAKALRQQYQSTPSKGVKSKDPKSKKKLPTSKRPVNLN